MEYKKCKIPSLNKNIRISKYIYIVKFWRSDSGLVEKEQKKTNIVYLDENLGTKTILDENSHEDTAKSNV